MELRSRGLITGAEVQQQIAGGHVSESSAVLGANRIAALEAKLKDAGVSSFSLILLVMFPRLHDSHRCFSFQTIEMQLMKEIDSRKEENAMLQLQIEGLKADQRDADDAHARQEKVKNRFCSSNSYCCKTSVD